MIDGVVSQPFSAERRCGPRQFTNDKLIYKLLFWLEGDRMTKFKAKGDREYTDIIFKVTWPDQRKLLRFAPASEGRHEFWGMVRL